MIRGNRELIAGLVRDPQFGATVMFGLGGILAEAVADVVFRPAPLDVVTAEEMIDVARVATPARRAFRGEAAVSRSHLVDLLVGLGRLAIERPDVVSVDVNPLIVDATGVPIAVDALVEIDARAHLPRADQVSRPRPERRGLQGACSSRAAWW